MFLFFDRKMPVVFKEVLNKYLTIDLDESQQNIINEVTFSDRRKSPDGEIYFVYKDLFIWQSVLGVRNFKTRNGHRCSSYKHVKE
jgi:hypothetical protein